MDEVVEREDIANIIQESGFAFCGPYIQHCVAAGVPAADAVRLASGSRSH